MRGVSRAQRAPAIETDRPGGSPTDQMVESVLSDIARALWPSNTAAHIAALVGCEVRTAERYLGGQRDWSSDALAIIVTEIMRRHGTRNMRVVARK